MDQRTTRARDLGLLVLAWAALFLPGFAQREFVNEEGRRALPAQAMLASGDYVVPRIYDRAYLAKPPALYWMIAAASAGGVTTATTRIPALVATLLTALVLYRVGNGWRRGAGLPAALLFLVSPLVLEKGALGEIETPFTLLCFAGGIACVQGGASGRRRGLAWTAIGGLLFGLAALTKGPPAWVFLGATLVGMASAPSIGPRRAAGHGALALGLSAAMSGLWVLLLVGEVDPATVRATWTEEVLGIHHGVLHYLKERGSFLVGTAAGLLPASAIVVAALVRPAERRALARSDLARIALVAVGVTLVFFLFYPRSRPRYILPIVPWVALLGGRLLAGLFERAASSRDPHPAFPQACAKWSAYVLGALGLVAAATGAVHALVHPLPLPSDSPVDAVGGALLAVLAAAGATALVLARRNRFVPALAMTLVTLGAARGFQLTQLARGHADHYARRTSATELDRTVGALRSTANPPVRYFTDHWGEFNLLAHVKAQPHYVRELNASPESTPAPGDLLLHPVPCHARRDPASGRSCPLADAGWKELLRLPSPKQPYEMCLFERQARAPLSDGGR